MPNLTKQVVDAAQPAVKPYPIWDDDLKGYFVRVMPSGTRTYNIVYRANGRQTWLTLGRHGALTPIEARKLAKQRLGEVASGRDPGAEKKTKREEAEKAKETIFG